MYTCEIHIKLINFFFPFIIFLFELSRVFACKYLAYIYIYILRDYKKNMSHTLRKCNTDHEEQTYVE